MWGRYLRYLWRRKNAFQIHSPFVYKLYTEVIRGKGTSGAQDGSSALAALGIRRKVVVPLEQLLDRYLSDRDPATLFVVQGIHDDRKNEALWDTICRHPDVILPMDLFREGWVCYREGMEKQHYVLKS